MCIRQGSTLARERGQWQAAVRTSPVAGATALLCNTMAPGTFFCLLNTGNAGICGKHIVALCKVLRLISRPFKSGWPTGEGQ